MKNKTLTELTRIGPRISEKLIKHFITKENVIKAISEGRISEIASIKGIGRKSALKIIREFHSDGSGIYSNDILKTDDGIKIRNKIIEILQSYAQTQYIKDKFSLMFPLPASKIDIINERVSYFKKSFSQLRLIDRDVLLKIHNMLKRIKPINPVNLRNKLNLHRLIITDSQKIYDDLIADDVEKYSQVLLIKSLKEKDLTYYNSFDIVIFLLEKSSNRGFINKIENSVIIERDWKCSDLIPEIILGNFIGPNYEIILTAYKLIKIILQITKKTGLFSDDFENVEIKSLEDLISNLKLIDKNGQIISGNNIEYDKSNEIINNFDQIIAEQELWINEKIEEEIKTSETTLKGNQIFELLQSVDESKTIPLNNLMEFLPLNLSTIIEDILIKAREKLIKALCLEDPDSSIVFDIFPNELNFPIEADNYTIKKLKNSLSKRKKFFEFQFISQIAENLNKYKILISDCIKILFKLDELLALKLLKEDYDLSFPKFYKDYRGLSFKNAKSVFLLCNNEKTVPINYHVGKIPLAFDRDDDINNDTIILTGANSGGKTTLLQTIAQVVIMGQMGISVPGEANIGPFDEIYYFSKSQGVISSGAFETSIKQFTNAIISNENKLVLMDELEAITEPGAAAKVVGGILEMFQASKSAITILVSHLAEQIIKEIDIHIRIDGIEANGLKDGELIVDRNPKFNYLAKSMPFFIIKKLFESTSDPNKQGIYLKMMNLLKDDK
ncbi:MAG: hypothetical protein GF329_19805 [Candidatus Lokiarchaeota archaeon]|nr:hypothetical protein [Candidatus Lokiarchaeota archaeon]